MKTDLQRENAELRRQLAEAEEALAAIRSGQVDAIVVDGAAGAQVFSLAGAETVYRLAVQAMAEAVINVTFEGTILFCNPRFSEFVATPAEQLIGRDVAEFVAVEEREGFRAFLQQCLRDTAKQRIVLRGPGGRQTPVYLTGEALAHPEGVSLCLVAADLRELESSAHQVTELRDHQAQLRQSRAAALNLMEDALAARQRAEQALARLRESEERFRLALKNSPVLVTMQDTNLVYQWVYNTRTRRPDEVIGKTDADLFAPEEAAALTAAKRQVLDSGTEVRRSLWLTSNGQRMFLDCYYEPVRDAGGRIIGVGGASVNLTERKQAEQALAQERDLLQTIMDGAANTHLVYLDRDFNFVRVNAAYARTCGCRPEEMIGKNHFALYPHPENEAIFGHVRDTGVAFEVHDKEFAFPDDPGRGITYWDWSLTPVKDATGNVQGLVFALHETTPRKQAEVELARTRRILETLLATAPLGFCHFDRELRYLRINERLAAMNGLAAADHIGKTVAEIVPALAPAALEVTARILATGEPIVGHELSGETSAQPGVTRHWSESWYPVREENGAITGFGVIVEEITARKQAEEQIKQLNATLEQRVLARTEQLAIANAELEAFCYSVSHDLRAPLRSMDGFSRILLQDYAQQIDDTGRDYLQRVRTACQRMGQLIDDLLRLSRLTRAEMRYQPLDLSALARSLATELQQSAPERVVEFRIAPNLHTSADAELVRVALQNLLENAWKFSGKQHKAVIEVGTCQEPHAPQSPTNPLPDAPVFYVRDNGVGFDMVHAGKLFGAFQRMHTLSEFPGSGIGLAIVQRVIHRHGGRIWATAAPGQGATFFFTLPEKGPVSQ